MQQYGILVKCPMIEKMNGLLTERGKPDIYRTDSLHDAELEARGCLALAWDMDANTRGMSASIVPLNHDNSFGSPMKKYQFETGRDSGRIVELVG